MTIPPWGEANPDYKEGQPITVDMIMRTLNAAHEVHAIQDLVVAFTYYDPERGKKTVFRNASQMPIVELIGLTESIKIIMAHNFLHTGGPAV